MTLPTVRSTIVVAALIAGFVISCTATPAARIPTSVAPAPSASPAPRIIGPLHTEGTRILDARGQTVRFTGVDVVGLQSGAGNTVGTGTVGPCGAWRILPQEEFDQIDAWGFNSVRVGIAWSNLEPNPPTGGRHAYNAPYVAEVDAVVKAFTDRGIAVILQMAQSKWSPAFKDIPAGGGSIRCEGYGMPTWLYPDAASMTIGEAKIRFFTTPSIQQGYADAWAFIASRYATDPMVVGFDMMNEPYVTSGQQPQAFDLDAFYAKLGAAIRSVNPDGLLIFQDTQDPGTGLFGVTSPLPFRNVVYSFHLYVSDWTKVGLPRTQTYLSRARSWNVPLWIGEFDAFTYAGHDLRDPNWQADLAALMSYCRIQGIGWSLFAYGDDRLLAAGTTTPKPGLLAALQSGF